MTTLIYRGHSYSAGQRPLPPVAQDLIYRGHRHDGLAPASPAAGRAPQLSYRGVAYSRSPADGAIQPAPVTTGRPVFALTPALAAA